MTHGLLLVLGVFGSLLVAEGLAGLLWDAPWYERLLTEQRETQERSYRRNSLGLRGPEPAVPKPAGTRRVLLVGDSFTFGLGVEDETAPFPVVLQERLAAAGPARVEIVNGGIPGSLTSDWVALWNRAGEAIDPDVVIAVFFLRDGTSLATIPHFFEKIRDEVARRNEGSRLYAWSHLYRRVRDFQDRSKVAEIYTQSLIDAYFGEQNQEWRKAQRNLLRLRDMAETHGAAFGLAIFPVLIQLDETYPFRRVSELLASFAVENGIPSHDLLPAFMGRDGPDLWVSAFDQHPNAAGHAIAAESLQPFVEELLERRAGGAPTGASL